MSNFKPSPAVARRIIVTKSADPWYTQVLTLARTPTGLTIGVVGGLIIIFCFLLMLAGVVVGDPMTAIGGFVGIILLGGGGYLLVRYVLQQTKDGATPNDDSRGSYRDWKRWLELQYNLKLTDTQNDQLVNATRGEAIMQNDGTWGTTTITRRGKPLDIRLSGNDFDGYRIEHRAQFGQRYVELKRLRDRDR